MGISIYMDDQTDDQELMRRAQNGDAEAFGELYDLLYPRLLSFTLRKTESNHHLSEDIVAETWVKALKHLQQFTPEPGKPVVAWLYQIAGNELKMYWRKSYRYHFEALEAHPQLRDEHAGVIDHAIAHEEQALVHQALAKLSDDDRQLIQQHYFQYIPLTTIAQQSSTRLGTIKSRISRARKKLQQIVEQLQPDVDSRIISSDKPGPV